MRDVVGSENTDSVCGSLEILASLQEANQQLTDAVSTLRDVLEIKINLFGEDKPQVAVVRTAIARLEALDRISPGTHGNSRPPIN